jgi:hypothetical protein
LNRSPHGNKTARDQYVGQAYDTMVMKVYVPLHRSSPKSTGEVYDQRLLNHVMDTCFSIPTVTSVKLTYPPLTHSRSLS